VQSAPVAGSGSRSDNGVLSGGGSARETASGGGSNAGERSSKRARRTRTDTVSLAMSADSNSNTQESSSNIETRRETSSVIISPFFDSIGWFSTCKLCPLFILNVTIRPISSEQGQGYEHSYKRIYTKLTSLFPKRRRT